MTLNITISTNHLNRTYHEGDIVSGHMIIDCQSEEKHDGILLSFEGLLIIQMSSKSAGILDSIVTSSKPVVLISLNQEIMKSGKLQAGRSKFPFEFTLKPNSNRKLYETFHGIHIIVQYILRCDVKKNILVKDAFKTQEIIINLNHGEEEVGLVKQIDFNIHSDSLQNVCDRTRIPKFSVKGHFTSAEFPIYKAITGELLVSECSRGISSIELQLVRVESYGANESQSREVSEIQSNQICSGDIARDLLIPIYMKIPQIFTCASISTLTFKIEFEINVIIIFDNDHLVSEIFPIKLTRY